MLQPERPLRWVTNCPNFGLDVYSQSKPFYCNNNTLAVLDGALGLYFFWCDKQEFPVWLRVRGSSRDLLKTLSRRYNVGKTENQLIAGNQHGVCWISGQEPSVALNTIRELRGACWGSLTLADK